MVQAYAELGDVTTFIAPARASGGKLLDNSGNCYLRTKSALARAGQTKSLGCKASRTTCGLTIVAGYSNSLAVARCDRQQ